MKSLKELLHYILYLDNTGDRIRLANIPRYYFMGDLLDTVMELYNEGGVVSNHDITVIATSHEGYQQAMLKGFHTVYLYDLLDFAESDRDGIHYVYYYLKGQSFTPNYRVILESIDGIPGDLVKKLYDSLHPSAIMIVMYDGNIPKRYNSPDDAFLIKNMNPYYLEKIKSNKALIDSNINNLLNKIRNKSTKIEEVLDETRSGFINMKKIDTIRLSEIIDLSSVIVTPHILLVKNLNNQIREYINITGVNKTASHLPVTGEPMITHDVAECKNIETGEIYCLPRGFRFVAKRTNVTTSGICEIWFDYLRPDGILCECLINCSVSYLEFLSYGESTKIHTTGSYKVFYGYVIPDFLSTDNSFDRGIVIYDYTLSNTKDDLYTSIIPIKKDLTIYYSLDKPITDKIMHY